MHTRALLLTVLGLLTAWPIASASAADPVLPEKFATPNFVVHYTTAPGGPDTIAAATAQTVAANAEKALAAEEAAFGFDPPLSGPDAHIDIYVYEFRVATEDGLTGPRSPDADQSESYILLRAGHAASLALTAHEVFHVLQDSVWVAGGKFLDEATAEWAQTKAFPADGTSKELDPTVPLDCTDDKACPDAGYQSWSFFEFLAERYGARIVREVFEQAKALRVTRGGAPLAAVSAALAAHGTTLGTSFRDFALANINGDYTLDELKDGGIGALTDTTPLRTGGKAAKLPRRGFKVDHLSTNYVPVFAGGGKKVKCRKATLRLDISGPKADAFAGYVLGEGKPKRVPLANGRGRVTLRAWSTCSGPEMILALINGGTSGDGRTFAVTATLTPR